MVSPVTVQVVEAEVQPAEAGDEVTVWVEGIGELTTYLVAG